MKGYFILLVLFLLALFLYNKFGKKLEGKATEAAEKFGYSQDTNN